MPKYRVPVTITAKSTYTVEVEARGPRDAEEKAINLWRDNVGSDFQVADYDEAEADAEQLTWECEACDQEISYQEWAKGDTQCISCNAKEAAHCAEI